LNPTDDIAIDVWHVAPPALDDEQLASCEALLSEAERAAVRRFVSEANQRERLAARALVRSVLAGYLGVDTSSVRFDTGAFGKPEIAPPAPLRFNLAHHPTLVVCAVAADREVGVDVEPLSRHAQIMEVAETVFAPSERAELEALDATGRADRAVSLWTAKEAYIKARGAGLSLPLRKLAWSFDEDRPRLSADPSVDSDPSGWALAFADLDDHRIAVVVRAPSATLRIRLHAWTVPSRS
jgi:4'-phosphopantetheinyl transferase